MIARWTKLMEGIVLAATFLVACSDELPFRQVVEPDRELPLLSHEEFAPVRITSRVVNSDSLLSLPIGVRVLNDSALLVIEVNNPFFHLVDRETGNILQSRGRRGRGPGEFQSVAGVTTIQGDGRRFWVYEVERNMLTLVDLDKQAGPSDSILTLPGRGANLPLAANDSNVLVMLRTDSSTIARFDLHTGLMHLSGVPPERRSPEGDTLSARTRRALANEARMCYEPTRDEFAAVWMHAGRVTLLDAAGTERKTALVPYKYDELLQKGGESGFEYRLNVGRPNQRRSYLGCLTTRDFVIALYSGRRFGSFDSFERGNAEFLHVFDWEGDLAGVIRLDSPIVSMALDERSLELFGVRYAPEPAIVAFKLGAALAELKAKRSGAVN